MILYNYIFSILIKLYKYIFKINLITKKHWWNKFLNNKKVSFYLNKNFNKFKLNLININSYVFYFFINYNVNVIGFKKKINYLKFIKKFILIPNIFNISRSSSFVLSLNYEKIFFKRFLYWYYGLVKKIKFLFNYNNLINVYNEILNKMNFNINIYKYRFFFFEKKINIYKYLYYKIYYKIFRLYKQFLYVFFLRSIRIVKNFYPCKYFFFSFKVKKFNIYKRRNKYNKNNKIYNAKYLLKKLNNYIFFFNNILIKLFLFIIKNWLNLYMFNILKKDYKIVIKNKFNKDSYFFFWYLLKIKFYNFIYKKFQVSWKKELKIIFLNYFFVNKFLINFKKFNIF